MRVIVYAGTTKERKALDQQGVLRRANIVLTSYSILERPDGSAAMSKLKWKVRRAIPNQPNVRERLAGLYRSLSWMRPMR